MRKPAKPRPVTQREVDLTMKFEAEIARLRAALDEIVRNGDQGIHVPGPYDIAKVALAKEGK